jgi:hypothetical protein
MTAYKLVRASEAPDFTGGAPVGAYFGYGRPLGAEQVAFNVRVLAPGAVHVPPDTDPTSGHSHIRIEEIYFVIDGEITMKTADDVVILKARDAVLVPPESPARFATTPTRRLPWRCARCGSKIPIRSRAATRASGLPIAQGPALPTHPPDRVRSPAPFGHDHADGPAVV